MCLASSGTTDRQTEPASECVNVSYEFMSMFTVRCNAKLTKYEKRNLRAAGKCFRSRQCMCMCGRR